MNRLSRLLVLLSLLAAAVFEVRLAAPEYGPLLRQTQLAFAAGVIGAAIFPRGFFAAALAFAYIAPVTLSVSIGRFRLTYLLIWIALLLGGLTGSRPWRGWSLPLRWRWPIAAWALAVAAAWPIVMWREANFDFDMLGSYRMPTTSGGIPPAVAGLGILDAVITQLLGLLWFDWLYDRFRGEPQERFHRFVAGPLAISAVLACLLGTYQGFVDISLWSAGMWPALRRAAGGMLDANAFGMVAACWAPASLVFARRWPMPAGGAIAGAGTLLAVAAAWSSGSRTALLATLIGLGFVGAVSIWRLDARRKQIAALTLVPLAAAAILLVTLLPQRTIGPLERLRDGIQRSASGGLHGVFLSLWHRDAYGAASTIAIREAPWFGVGAGAFTLLSVDYAAAATGYHVPYDNAQNWFRHQIAELGVVGSAGWIAWTLLFAWTLMRSPAQGTSWLGAAAIKGAILGLTAASMLGVPTQATAVTLTFWTFAFWYLLVAVPPGSDAEAVPSALNRPIIAWPLVLALVFLHVAGTSYAARHELNPAERARRFGYPYEHGFYPLEQAATRAVRLTAQRGVIVMPSKGRMLTVSVWTDDPDAAEEPVMSRVWINGRLVLDTPLKKGNEATLRVPIAADERWLIVRTWVERPWRQPQGTGTREAGLSLSDWTFRE